MTAVVFSNVLNSKHNELKEVDVLQCNTASFYSRLVEKVNEKEEVDSNGELIRLPTLLIFLMCFVEQSLDPFFTVDVLKIVNCK